MKSWWRAGAAALALLALPDGAAARAQEALHANPRLAAIPLTLTAAGRQRRYTVEVARTPAEQERGLMFRTRMARDHGMLFPTAPPRTAQFWMRNTLIPLDIIFIGPDRKVLNVAARATPKSLDLLGSNGPVIAVLELNGGEAARVGLQPGDAIDW